MPGSAGFEPGPAEDDRADGRPEAPRSRFQTAVAGVAQSQPHDRKGGARFTRVVREAVGNPNSILQFGGRSGAEGEHSEESASPEYRAAILEAKRCIGSGQVADAFPEEWDVQMLLPCGTSAEGHSIVAFSPAFLKPLLGSESGLERAAKFVLLGLDGIAMRKKYVFVYCHAGVEWRDPSLVTKLKECLALLPLRYTANLQKMYVLHATTMFRSFLWSTHNFWFSTPVWERLEYAYSIDDLCKVLHPGNDEAQKLLRSKLPHVVQREDAIYLGVSPPLALGTDLPKMCEKIGIDFYDRTTGFFYEKVPPALVFVCEALERQGGDEAFRDCFIAPAEALYDVVKDIDEGEPLQSDVGLGCLWTSLKLFLDTQQTPLLSFQAFEELMKRDPHVHDTDQHIAFLREVLYHKIPACARLTSLYLASFLNTMCETAQRRRETDVARLGQHSSDSSSRSSSSSSSSSESETDGAGESSHEPPRRKSKAQRESNDEEVFAQPEQTSRACHSVVVHLTEAQRRRSMDSQQVQKATDEAAGKKATVADELVQHPLTERVAAEIFAPGLLRPARMTPDAIAGIPLAIAVVETFILHARELHQPGNGELSVKSDPIAEKH